jgi:tetratricopeptide (TPR) repeat protein/DNA-binding XRE family transcriptional regulator
MDAEQGVCSETGSDQTFGRLLRGYRSIAGLTQEELAKRSGLSLRALSNIERDRSSPFPRSARMLADALGLAGAARAQLMATLVDRLGENSTASSTHPRADEYRRLAVPRQLPAAVFPLIGRDTELDELRQLLEEVSGEAPRTMLISAIVGTAGVGKTALALYWAQQVAYRFPDGQLYVNLRGFDMNNPLDAADALTGFLRSLGVPERDVPVETEERAALYRSLLADRRVLVILDNARNAEQVRPLLPGTPSCTVVVTSRDALAGLVARDGACRIDLALLSLADAARLLRELIGEGSGADPRATAEIARRCARLPLALRLAAERAKAWPHMPLADLAEELANQGQRLDLLDTQGDQQTAVRSVFSWSIRHISEDAARAFRWLGLHPGSDFDLRALVALMGCSPQRARRTLADLVRACLVQTTGPDRYGMHDLLHTYAAEQCGESYSTVERRAALTRLFDNYLSAATASADIMFAGDPDRPKMPHLDGNATKITSVAAAWNWLEAERANLLATASLAVDCDLPLYAVRLSEIIFRYPIGGYYANGVVIHVLACCAAAQNNDLAAEARARTRLGDSLAALGKLRQARAQLTQALRQCCEAGDRLSEIRALASLGRLSYCQGHYGQAASYSQDALELATQFGDWAGEASAMINLSAVDLRQGRHEQAAQNLRRSLALYRDAGIQSGVASVLSTLGELEMRRGHYELATSYLGQSLALCRKTGHRPCEARSLARLGLVMLRLGRYEQASWRFQQALALHGAANDGSDLAAVLNGLGETSLATSQPESARIRHREALTLARRVGDKYERARAHEGLANAYRASGDDKKANHHWDRALTDYTELGVPEAREVRIKITTAR